MILHAWYSSGNTDGHVICFPDSKLSHSCKEKEQEVTQFYRAGYRKSFKRSTLWFKDVPLPKSLNNKPHSIMSNEPNWEEAR